MKSRMLGAAMLLLPMSLTQSSWAQTQKAPLAFGSDVTVIAVPVFVTGKDGKSIPGLTVADFELLDGGKPVAIDSFLAIDADKPVGNVGERTSPAMRRQFLFLFDLTFSKPMNLERARRAAKQVLLRDFSPGDLAAVGTVNPGGFKALLGFTPDKSQAIAAIDGLGLGAAGRERDPLALVYDIGAPSERSGSADRTDSQNGKQQQLQDELKDQATQLRAGDRSRYLRSVQQFLGGFQGLARTLDSVKGRKQIILFSDGFDGSVLTGATGVDRAESAQKIATGQLWEVDNEQYFGSAAGQGAMDGLYTALRGSDVVVHTIDLKGLGETVNLASQEGEEARVQGKDSLAELASNSGGRFVRSTNNLESGLGEILAATRDFYVLAFTPSSSDRGKPRKLVVKVKRPGVSVSHRATYTLPDLKKPDLNRPAMEAAEIIAKGISGGPIKVRAYALPYRAKDGKVALPVVIQIPADALQEAVKRKQVGLQVYGYLVDQNGAVVDFFQATPVIDPTEFGEALKKSGLQIITTFAAVAGPVEVRLLVRDPTSAAWGAFRLPVDVPSFAGATTAFASSPMVVDDPFSRVALPTTTHGRPAREIPFRLDNRPITVDADPILKRGEAREICVYVRPAKGDVPAIQLELVGSDGAKHAQKADKVSVIRDSDGFDRVVFFVSPSGVEPGEYALSVVIAGASSSSPVRIQ